MATLVRTDVATARPRPQVPVRRFMRRAAVPGASLVGLTAATLHTPDGLALAPAAVGVTLWAVALLVRPTAPAGLRHGVARPVQVAALVFAAIAAVGAAGLFSIGPLVPTLVALGAATATVTVLTVLHRFRSPTARVLLVGDSRAVAAQSALWAERAGVEVVGHSVRRASRAADEPAERIAQRVADLEVDTVVVCPGAEYSARDLEQLSWELESSNVVILVAGVVNCAPHRISASMFAGVPVVAVAPSRRSRLHLAVKSAIDRAVAAVLLVLVSPLLLVLCLAIRLESKGSPVFEQRRVGQGGKPFVMFKLRTMRSDGPRVDFPLQRTAGNEVLFKMKDDPRVTRVGRVLRQLSLDELPQLVNVVRGEMSLIGPRPALFEETSKYDLRAWRRTAVKPGITGLWQVSGRSDLSWEKSVALDVHYVDNWRLADDLAIAAKTVWVVMGKKGAY